LSSKTASDTAKIDTPLWELVNGQMLLKAAQTAICAAQHVNDVGG